MRTVPIVTGEIYHLFNRGMHKQHLFRDQADYWRFLFGVLHFQSPLVFANPAYNVKRFIHHTIRFTRPSGSYIKTVAEITKNRLVELIAFTFMPNHFHLLVKEIEEGGISQYLGRLQNSQTKYFNTKYQTGGGHLLQGPYRAVQINDNDQLLYTSAYIHRNCRELPGWKNKELTYRWSSAQDYLGKNRFEGLLVPDIILDQFTDQNEYRFYLKESPAKDPELLDPEGLLNL